MLRIADSIAESPIEKGTMHRGGKSFKTFQIYSLDFGKRDASPTLAPQKVSRASPLIGASRFHEITKGVCPLDLRDLCVLSASLLDSSGHAQKVLPMPLFVPKLGKSSNQVVSFEAWDKGSPMPARHRGKFG
jgi:hypothetical protein